MNGSWIFTSSNPPVELLCLLAVNCHKTLLYACKKPEKHTSLARIQRTSTRPKTATSFRKSLIALASTSQLGKSSLLSQMLRPLLRKLVIPFLYALAMSCLAPP